MPSFLEDISGFYGTKEKNELGQDLEDFLEEYDPKKYDNPSVTADILVFRHEKDFDTVNKGLKLLMIKRRNHPSIGFWALPGGFIEMDEDIEAAAKRELEEETSLKGIAIEQLYTWGEAWRDPRARIITTSFLALVDDSIGQIQAGDDAADAIWMDVQFKELEKKNEFVDGKQKEIIVYQLDLGHNEKGIQLSATVERRNNTEGFIKEVSYQVLESAGIAFDHPRFIVQALLHLNNLMK